MEFLSITSVKRRSIFLVWQHQPVPSASPRETDDLRRDGFGFGPEFFEACQQGSGHSLLCWAQARARGAGSAVIEKAELGIGMLCAAPFGFARFRRAASVMMEA